MKTHVSLEQPAIEKSSITQALEALEKTAAELLRLDAAEAQAKNVLEQAQDGDALDETLVRTVAESNTRLSLIPGTRTKLQARALSERATIKRQIADMEGKQRARINQYKLQLARSFLTRCGIPEDSASVNAAKTLLDFHPVGKKLIESWNSRSHILAESPDFKTASADVIKWEKELDYLENKLASLQ